MARILIVDDHPVNRDFLVTLLGFRGHELLEAADGRQALSIAQANQPDLIISDILMPEMDGYEFVRSLRANPHLAQIPIILSTAYYLKPEVRILAEACGVEHILMKPSEPSQVLETVEMALGLASEAVKPLPAGNSDPARLSQMTDTLAQYNDELSRANDRLSALIDLNLQLATEQDPEQLLNSLGRSARKLIGAMWSVVCILDDDNEQNPRYFITSGLTAEAGNALGQPLLGQEINDTLLNKGHPYRLGNPHGDPETVGFPSAGPKVHAFLAAPIKSLEQTYGWLALVDKIEGGAFSEQDEHLIHILSAQVGRIYENMQLYAAVQQHATVLEREIAERKQAEAALRESEEKFSAAFRASPTAFVITTLEGKFVEVNQAFCDLIGYSQEKILGQTAADFDLVSEQYRERLVTAITQAGGSVRNAEVKFKVRDGSLRDILYSQEAIFFHGVPHRLAIGVDITERKQAEEALKASQTRLAGIINSAMDAIITIDAEQRIVLFNPAAEAMFGLPATETIGQSLNRFIPEPSQQAHQQHIKAFSQTGVTSRRMGELGSITGVRANGESFPIEASISQTRIEDQQLFTVILRDITERQRAEQAIRESEMRFRATFEQAAVGIAHIKLDGSWLRVNQKLGDIVGYSRQELLALDPQVLSHPDDREDNSKNSGLLLTGELDHYSLEKRLLHRDGTNIWVNFTMSVVQDDLGKPDYLNAVVQDITSRKHLEEQFYQAQKMEAIGHLAGGIAHDFNNVLVPILGYSELGMVDIPVDSKVYAYLKEIRESADRAAALTRQILAFSRKQVLEMRTMDLNTVITNIQSMIQRLIGEDIKLLFHLAHELCQIKADKGNIEQVLMNLVINARDAMMAGGKLTIETANVYLDETYAEKYVSAQTPGHYVMLAVSDTGHGMDVETQKQIFEPFFTTKERGKGTGLGLATVFGIVKQHGGNIWVYSEPGLGTTFKIYLPITVNADPIIDIVDIEPETIYGSETIFVVEDEARVRKLVCDTLTTYGYDVIEIENPLDCLQRVANHVTSIHLLLTDVILPEMSGVDLYHKLTAIDPDIKVLYMSGYTDDAIGHHHVLAEGVNFIQKPFTVTNLVQKVKQVLS